MKSWVWFGLLAIDICFASTCPPAHLVERLLTSKSSKIFYGGLTYVVDQSLFIGKTYQLSKTAFIEAEISGSAGVLKGDALICAYSTFSQYERKWGDVLLKTRHQYLIPDKRYWFAHEGVHVCMHAGVERCAFYLASV